MAESIAENYFKQYTGSDAATVLSSLVDPNTRKFEDNWLDFKSGKVQPQDLEPLWSKAIGAMANAGGGVVIFGIYAAKHGTPPVDAAEKLELVPDINALKSRLVEISHFATDPPLANIRIEAIPIAKGAKDGFVVCLIPEGIQKAYMSLRTKKPFYIRIGDESKEPPLPILRQLFNPSLSTRATMKFTYALQESESRPYGSFYVDFTNIGLTSIERAAFAIETEGVPIGGNLEDVFLNGTKRRLYKIHALLHPSMTDSFFVGFEFPRWQQETFKVIVYQRNQEVKADWFIFEFSEERFVKDGMYNRKQIVLNF
jgi:hypothetical protein